MVKAEDLQKRQKLKNDEKKKIYIKILERIEKKIMLASSTDSYYCLYEIPSIILGLPIYSVEKCKEYVIKKLKKNGFKIKEIDDNKIFISWLLENNNNDDKN